MKTFMDEEFLLQSESASKLYHEFAENQPIFDYHCHLPPQQIADDINFENLSQAWLAGDHYKWRGMRSNGVSEKYCTGDATDEEKFAKWAETVPHTLRNPLYHWTHLELKRYFGVDELLNPKTANGIYDKCSEMLRSPEFSVRSLLTKSNVRAVCTTDDPADSLEHHKKCADDGLDVKVWPTFRPDAAMNAESPSDWNSYIDRLGSASAVDINSFAALVEALQNRHDFFHEMGGRVSDHGLDTVYADDYTEREVEDVFAQLRAGKAATAQGLSTLKSAVMLECGRMDAEKGWVQQLHMGALRNNNTRLFNSIGRDIGCDSIHDVGMAEALSGFLDKLDQTKQLPKTILYNLNPRDNEMLATMIGNFQDGSMPGKMQFGSGWWFQDQKDGMERQMNALSLLGLLSRFVGMLTDSRSFLSFPRHEYFRRILCNLLGNDIENGEIPADFDLVGGMVSNICFANAKDYFGVDI
jgi:glucuronate isomerase